MKHAVSEQPMKKEILELSPVVASVTQNKDVKTKTTKLRSVHPTPTHIYTQLNIYIIIYISKTLRFHCFH